jgi:putative ABC transport system permease protein
MTATLQNLLPNDVIIEPPQSRSANIMQIKVVISGLMFVVSSMILLVGSTLIFNTMSVAVAQRRGEIGVLRALGTLRHEVRATFVIEAAVLGFIGSVIGTILGIIVVQTASQLPILPDFSNAALKSTPEISVPLWLPPLAVSFGVGISVLAGYLPSRSAARVDPVEALTPVRVETGFMTVNRRRVTMALVGIVVGTILIFTHDPEGGAIVVPLTAIWLLLGAAILLLPTFLVLLGTTLPNLMHRLFGMPGLLAAENLTKRPKRMTATAGVLLIAVWAGIVASSGNFGYRGFADEWNSGENVWDLIVVGPGKNPFLPTISLPEGIGEEIAAREDVAVAVPDRLGSVRYQELDLQIRAIDIAGFRSQNAGFLWKTGDPTTAYAKLQDADHPALLMSAALAAAQLMKVGDTVTLDTPSGAVTFEIVGTVLNAVQPGTPFENSIVLDLTLYRRLWDDPKIDRLYLKLQPDSDLQAARRELLSTYALRGVVVISAADLTAAFGKQLDSIVVVSQIMSVLLMGTLVVGIANTLFIVVLDRRREMGTLRALGLRTRQITASVVIEAGILVVLAAILAVPLGIVNNYVNTLSMENVFGVRFALAADEIVMTLVVIFATTVLAAYFPARHAGQVDVLSALRYE